MSGTGRSSSGTCTYFQISAALHVDGNSEKVLYADPGKQFPSDSWQISWSRLYRKDSIISATGTLSACFLRIISPFFFFLPGVATPSDIFCGNVGHTSTLHRCRTCKPMASYFSCNDICTYVSVLTSPWFRLVVFWLSLSS